MMNGLCRYYLFIADCFVVGNSTSIPYFQMLSLWLTFGESPVINRMYVATGRLFSPVHAPCMTYVGRIHDEPDACRASLT